MKYKTINYKGFELTIEKRIAMDRLQYFCIIRKDNNRIVSRYKLRKHAIWQLEHFEQFPILPI